MKKKLIILILFVINFLSVSSVKAELIEKTIDVSKSMLEHNDITFNTDYYAIKHNENLGLQKDSAVAKGAYYYKDFGDTAESNFNQYVMFMATSKDASVTMTYKDIAYFNTGKYEGKSISIDMTIDGLKMGNGTRDYIGGGSNGGFGFNKFYPGMILFEAGEQDKIYRGSIARVTLRFFFTDSNPKEYISVGNLNIGIGGFNSQKKIPNTNQLGAPQWEWVSFENTQGTTIGSRDQSCLIARYSGDYYGLAKDYDGNSETFSWSGNNYAPGYSFSENMSNPTKREIVSNGGNRYPQILNVMADSQPWTNYATYRNRIKLGYWTFNVPEVEYEGKTISQFQFEFGKTYGTVELGLRPVILANSIPPAPKKSVDKSVASEQEELTYTIDQKTGTLQENASKMDTNEKKQAFFDSADTIERYESFEIVDEIPDEVEYVENSVTVDRLAQEKVSAATLNLGTDYTVKLGESENGKKQITIAFTENYLKNKNGMPYMGETYRIKFKARVKDLTYAQAQQLADGNYKIFTATNGVKTVINGTTSVGNKVTTQIVYDILTKGENTNITDKLVELDGGSSGHKVTFSPKRGYYIESVEWQTQSQRYANSTPELANVNDIPSDNKITIPRTKTNNVSYPFSTNAKDSLNYDEFSETTFTFDNIEHNHFVKVVSAPLTMVINISKEDSYTLKEPQLDATFEGAVYTIYQTNNNGILSDPVETVTLDAQGNGHSSGLLFNKVDGVGNMYGEYFVKETKAPEGYVIDENVYTVYQALEEQLTKREKVSYHNVVSKEKWGPIGEVNLVKISEKKYYENEEKINKLLEENNIEEFNKLAEEFGLEEAKYQVFTRENDEYIALKDENGEDVIFTTGENGVDKLTLTYGTYYLKEIQAPEDHQLDPNYIEINVMAKTSLVVAKNAKIIGKIKVRHVDEETGEDILDEEHYEDDVGEEYKTKDKEKEVNEKYGADFDIYEYVEEKEPENKDGVYKKEEQEVVYVYRRKKGLLTVIKKDDETGVRLSGCVFTIVEKNTGKVLVENAVTDENGEFNIENVPYGIYIFTEVKAPEGYEVDERCIGVEFDIKSEETTVEVTNKLKVEIPYTGDIVVYAFALLFIVSAIGIVYITKKKVSVMK